MTKAMESPILDCKHHQTTRGKTFGSPTKKFVKRAVGALKETSSTAPSIMKHSSLYKLKLVGRRLLIEYKDLIIPYKATWLKQVDNKRDWETIIMEKPGAKMLKKTGHKLKTEVAVHRATCNTILDTMYLDTATQNLKGEDEA
jgi:hypothetical protein